MATWLGRYRLLTRLGAGTLGEVFRAKVFGVEGFEKVLAVKRLLPELGAHPAVVDAFAGAAQQALLLSHANVVQVLDVGRTDEPGPVSLYLAMELVSGLNLGLLLADLRARGREVPLGLTAFVGAEIAKALGHAHRRRDDKGRSLGLVHGGLGPANVLLSWEGEVKVADFGLAHALTVAPPSDVVAGARAKRLAYESPELAAGAPASARSDLYALGVVLREILAAGASFPSDADDRTRASAQDALAQVVARLVAVDPNDRPLDAGAVHDELLGQAYAFGERFGAADLAALLRSARGGVDGGLERRPNPLLDGGDEVASPALLPASSVREVAVLLLAGAPNERSRAAVDGLGGVLVADGVDELATLLALDGSEGYATARAARAALGLVRSRAASARAAGLATGSIGFGPDDAPERGAALDALISASRALAGAAKGHVVASVRAIETCGAGVTTDELPGSPDASPDAARVVLASSGASDPGGRFVGRTRELGRLGEALTDATAGRARRVTVTGPAGIGKTRFVSEALRRLAKRGGDVGVYAVACPVGGVALPWSAALAMVAKICGVQVDVDSDGWLEAAARLRALGLPDAQADAVLARLGGGATASSSEADGARSFEAGFEHMLRSLSADRPHVFVWDDAHELDAFTAAALTSLACRADELRALVLLATPEPLADGTATNPALVSLPLGELDTDDTARLLATRVGARIVPAALLARCRDRAGGVPRALELLVRELLDTGAVRVVDGIATLRPDEQARS